MTASHREYIEHLERRIRRAERTIPVLCAALVVVALSASTPGTGLPAMEARVAMLETLIRPGQGGSSQVQAPFQVVDASGRVLLHVATGGRAGLVNITTPPGTQGALVSLITRANREVAYLGVNAEGNGRIATVDAAGKAVGMMSEVGLAVLDKDENQIAGMTRGEGGGRVAIWRDKRVVSQLTSDQAGNGRVNVYDAAGKLHASIRGEEGFGVFSDSGKSVVSMINKSGRGLVGVSNDASDKLVAELAVDTMGGGLLRVKSSDGKAAIGMLGSRRTVALANAQGATVAEMTVSPDGRGLFQIWGTSKAPLAVLGKAVEGQGGILQISNGTSVITSLTVSPGGSGFWQLNDAAGTPIVEAGMAEGRGTVRAGPAMQCAPTPAAIVNRVPDCIRGRAPQ